MILISKILFLLLGFSIIYHILENKEDRVKDAMELIYIKRKYEKSTEKKGSTYEPLLLTAGVYNDAKGYNMPGYTLTEYLDKQDSVNRWFKQLNEKGEYKVKKWEFLEDLSHIRVKFEGKEECNLELYYEDSEVTKVHTDQEIDFLNAYVKPKFEFTEEQILQNFKFTKKDKRRLSYINKVANEAMRVGIAEFNILEYEGKTLEEYHTLYGEKENSAFIRMLLEDFKEAVYQGEGIFIVTPIDEPKL